MSLAERALNDILRSSDFTAVVRTDDPAYDSTQLVIDINYIVLCALGYDAYISLTQISETTARIRVNLSREESSSVADYLSNKEKIDADTEKFSSTRLN